MSISCRVLPYERADGPANMALKLHRMYLCYKKQIKAMWYNTLALLMMIPKIAIQITPVMLKMRLMRY